MTPPTNDSPSPAPESPNPTPEMPPAPASEKPQEKANPQRPQPGGREGGRERGRQFESRRPRPEGQKPRNPGGAPVNRTVEDFPTGPKIRDLDADIEAELNAAMAGFDTEMVADETKKSESGQTENGLTRGKVVSIHGPDVFVDVPGRRSQGMLPLIQFAETPPKVGDVVEFSIEGFDSANGLLKLSKSGAAAVRVDWSSVARGVVVEAKVIKTNKGGLEVEVNGLRGFMPFREIDIYRIENPETLVNSKLICQVTEVEPSEKNLVLSRRILLEKEREREKEKFWAGIEEGQERSGVVRSIKPFGVFVDLGGADGMIPVSELSWARVEKPEDAVQMNQKVQVKVTRVNRDEQKITLSLKQLGTSPWETLSQRFPVGSVITGKVTRTMEFGAFVELEPGVEGLIHISELGAAHVRRVRDAVQEGQEVSAQILSIDQENRRISLSLRSLADAQSKKETEEALAAIKAREEAEEDDDAPPVPAKKRNYNLKGGL
jgi:small subunit ribosomal protein S1